MARSFNPRVLASTRPSREQIVIGSRWACVSARGQGQVVTIRHTRENTVVFDVVKSGRSHAYEGKVTVPIDAFLVRFRPLEAINDTQRAMRIDEIQNGPRSEQVIEAAVVDAKRHEQWADWARENHIDGIVLSASKINSEVVRDIALLILSGESHQEVAEAFGLSIEALESILNDDSYRKDIDDVLIEMRRQQASLDLTPLKDIPVVTGKTGRISYISVEHARALIAVAMANKLKDIGPLIEASGVSKTSIRRIFEGELHGAATADLRANLKEDFVISASPRGKSCAITMAYVRRVDPHLRAYLDKDAIQSQPSQPALPPPAALKPVPQPAQEEPIMPPAQAITQTRLPAPTQERAPQPVSHQAKHDGLTVELADALEVLLQYRGRALPGFISLDAMHDLVARARA